MQRYSVKISDHKKEFQISVRNVLIINGGVNYFGTSAAKVSYLGVSYLNMQ